MKQYFKATAVLLTVFVVLSVFSIACGGGNGQSFSGNTAKKLAAGFSMIPGFHATGKNTKTTASNFDMTFEPKAYAQSSGSTSYAGSYTGSCARIESVVTGMAPIFGMGNLGKLNCYNPHADGSDDYFRSTDTFSGLPGAPVTGAGTLTSLRVDGNVAIANDPDSAKVEIYINHNGTLTNTGLSCQLTTVGSNTHCTSSGTFAVQDGDILIGMVHFGVGDQISSLRVFVSQQ